MGLYRESYSIRVSNATTVISHSIVTCYPFLFCLLEELDFQLLSPKILKKENADWDDKTMSMRTSECRCLASYCLLWYLPHKTHDLHLHLQWRRFSLRTHYPYLVAYQVFQIHSRVGDALILFVYDIFHVCIMIIELEFFVSKKKKTITMTSLRSLKYVLCPRTC